MNPISKTAFTSIIKIFIISFVYFILTPIIISKIGKEEYGLWVFIVQVVGYISWIDYLPGSALKLQIARDHVRVNDVEKQRAIGAVVYLVLKSSYLYIMGTLSLVIFLPFIINVESLSLNYARIVLVCLSFNLYLSKFVAIPQMVIRGVNKDYINSALLSIFAILSGILDYMIICLGFKIIGLAISKLIINLLVGSFYWCFTKNVVPWFKMKKPSIIGLKKSSRQNTWLYIFNVTSVLNNQFEIVAVGFLFDAKHLAIYATTSALIGKLYQMLTVLFNAINPTIGSLLGRNEIDKIKEMRLLVDKIYDVAIYSLFVTLIVCNQNFVSHWLGGNYFAGKEINISLLFMWSSRLIMVNAQRYYLISLKFKKAAYYQAVGGALFLMILVYFGKEKLSIIPIGIGIGCFVTYALSGLNMPFRETDIKIQLNKKTLGLIIFIIINIYVIYSNKVLISDTLITAIVEIIVCLAACLALFSLIILGKKDVLSLIKLLKSSWNQ